MSYEKSVILLFYFIFLFKTKRKRTKEWKYTSHVFGKDAATKLRERKKKKFISVMKKNEAKRQLRAQPISKWYLS
jgi:hypothetical protein